MSETIDIQAGNLKVGDSFKQNGKWFEVEGLEYWVGLVEISYIREDGQRGWFNLEVEEPVEVPSTVGR